MSNSHMPILRINAPEFYRDPQFLAWLNDPERVTMTWHQKGQDPTEYSDVIVTWDSDEGSDSDMPEHIWDQLCQVAREQYGPERECLIWISNLEE